MKELLVLRHAESMAGLAGDSDRSRALSPRGHEQARAVGQWLVARQLRPNLVLSSSARRARMTATLALAAFPAPYPAVELADGVYDATPGYLFDLLGKNDDARRVLLVGHNPGLTSLVSLLCSSESRSLPAMRPGTLAHIRIDGGPEPGHGRLVGSFTP